MRANVTDERIGRVSNYTSTYTSSASRELPGADLSARVDLRYRRFVRAHDQVQVRSGAPAGTWADDAAAPPARPHRQHARQRERVRHTEVDGQPQKHNRSSWHGTGQ